MFWPRRRTACRSCRVARRDRKRNSAGRHFAVPVVNADRSGACRGPRRADGPTRSWRGSTKRDGSRPRSAAQSCEPKQRRLSAPRSRLKRCGESIRLDRILEVCCGHSRRAPSCARLGRARAPVLTRAGSARLKSCPAQNPSESEFFRKLWSAGLSSDAPELIFRSIATTFHNHALIFSGKWLLK